MSVSVDMVRPHVVVLYQQYPPDSIEIAADLVYKVVGPFPDGYAATAWGMEQCRGGDPREYDTLPIEAA